jgi:hypothetical protein
MTENRCESSGGRCNFGCRISGWKAACRLLSKVGCGAKPEAADLNHELPLSAVSGPSGAIPIPTTRPAGRSAGVENDRATHPRAGAGMLRIKFNSSSGDLGGGERLECILPERVSLSGEGGVIRRWI